MSRRNVGLLVFALLVLPGPAAAQDAMAPSEDLGLDTAEAPSADSPEGAPDAIVASSPLPITTTSAAWSASDLAVNVTVVVGGTYMAPATGVKLKVLASALALCALPEGTNATTDLFLDLVAAGNYTADTIAAAEAEAVADASNSTQSGQGSDYLSSSGSSRKLLGGAWAIVGGDRAGVLASIPAVDVAFEGPEDIKGSVRGHEADEASTGEGAARDSSRWGRPEPEDLGARSYLLGEQLSVEDSRVDFVAAADEDPAAATASSRRRRLLSTSPSSSNPKYFGYLTVQAIVRVPTSSLAATLASLSDAIADDWLVGNATELGLSATNASLVAPPSQVTRYATWDDYVKARASGFATHPADHGWVAAAVIIPLALLGAALAAYHWRPSARRRRALRSAALDAEARDRVEYVARKNDQAAQYEAVVAAAARSEHIRAAPWGAGTSGAWGLPSARLVVIPCDSAQATPRVDETVRGSSEASYPPIPRLKLSEI